MDGTVCDKCGRVERTMTAYGVPKKWRRLIFHSATGISGPKQSIYWDVCDVCATKANWPPVGIDLRNCDEELLSKFRDFIYDQVVDALESGAGQG